MRIAIIGGADYIEEKLEDFLYALHAKYPDAIIVTGTAMGKNEYEDVPDSEKRKIIRSIPSAERAAESLMSGLGHTVEIPALTGPTAAWMAGTKLSAADLQVNMILSGAFELYRDANGKVQHRFTTPRADVIVTVGNPESSRAIQAQNHWKRMDAWRDKENQRPFHNVAAPAKQKKAKVYRAKKKQAQLAA